MKYIFRSHLKIFLLFGSIFRIVLQSEVYNENFILNLIIPHDSFFFLKISIREGNCFIRFCLYNTGSRDQNRFFFVILSQVQSRFISILAAFFYSEIVSCFKFQHSNRAVKTFYKSQNWKLNQLIHFNSSEWKNGRYVPVQMTSYFCR